MVYTATKFRYRSVLAVTAALVLSGGCTTADQTSGPGVQPSPTPNPTTTPASPVEIAKQDAIAAYMGMWRDMADAATTSDWKSPKLARHATGEALVTISRSLYADHYNGLVTRGQPVNHPEVSSVEPPHAPTTINITDCGDSTNWLKYRVDSGEPANDGPGGRRHIEALVKKAVDGSWKVTTFAVHEVGSCG